MKQIFDMSKDATTPQMHMEIDAMIHDGVLGSSDAQKPRARKKKLVQHKDNDRQKSPSKSKNPKRDRTLIVAKHEPDGPIRT